MPKQCLAAAALCVASLHALIQMVMAKPMRFAHSELRGYMAD